MTGARRLSQAISEGDGISIVALVRDADAATAAEGDGAAYAPALIKFAMSKQPTPPVIPAGAGMTGGVSGGEPLASRYG